MAKKLNITGQRFGRLVAVEDAGRTVHGNRLWRCQCDCGTEVLSRVASLRNGHKKSCGCYRRDFQSQESHRRWKGGYQNAGTLAWANNRIATINAQADRLGYSHLDATSDDVIALYERCGHECNICGHIPEDGEPALHLDHCHTTGRPRGFLCGKCNKGIGMFGESKSTMRNAIEYIELTNPKR